MTEQPLADEPLPDDLLLDSDADLLNDDFGGMNDFGVSEQNPMAKHSDLLKELTNFDPALKMRVRNWLGLEWDDVIKDYKQKHQAIMNEKGARWCIGFIQNYQQKTNIITNINEREFKNLQIDIIEVIWYAFATRDDFGVDSSSDLKRLGTEIEHAAFLVLAGAGDGKYTKFLGESVSRQETVHLGQDDKGNVTRPGSNPGFVGSIKNTLLGRH